jgi:hypothetical protein
VAPKSNRSLAALAIVVGGAVAAFAVYTVGWRQSGSRRTTRTVSVATESRRVFTVREGDVVRVPAAATECEVSGEAGIGPGQKYAKR